MPTFSGPGFGPLSAVDLVQISAANTNRDGTGTIVDVKTAGARGSSVSTVGIAAVGTTTVGFIRFFLHNGTAWRLLDGGEVAVSAITPSGSIAAFTATWTPANAPLLIPTGWKLGAATHNAETFNLIAKSADY